MIDYEKCDDAGFVECEECGVTIVATSAQYEDGMHFCDKECQQDYWKRDTRLSA
jgi:hypothetical protein